MEKLVKVLNVGRISYSTGLQLQRRLSKLHENENTVNNTLLCLEHSPVYTIGIRSQEYSEEIENELKKKGADFFRTNRGGLITFHGPGQLVVYPILNLKQFKPSMRWYVCQIERTVINLCKKFGLQAETSPHTGVWVNDKKICAIGIHGSKFITTHGLALNCSTDLTWFNHIVPCGIPDKGVTSLTKELDRVVSTEEVLPKFLESFSEIFNCSYVNFNQEEADKILKST